MFALNLKNILEFPNSSRTEALQINEAALPHNRKEAVTRETKFFTTTENLVVTATKEEIRPSTETQAIIDKESQIESPKELLAY